MSTARCCNIWTLLTTKLSTTPRHLCCVRSWPRSGDDGFWQNCCFLAAQGPGALTSEQLLEETVNSPMAGPGLSPRDEHMWGSLGAPPLLLTAVLPESWDSSVALLWASCLSPGTHHTLIEHPLCAWHWPGSHESGDGQHTGLAPKRDHEASGPEGQGQVCSIWQRSSGTWVPRWRGWESHYP